MSASEIDALLAELAQSNAEPEPVAATDPLLAEAAAEAPALEVEEGGGALSDEPAAEPALEVVEVAEPEAAESAEPEPAADEEPEPPKTFDMEDVLRAASEATNMSTDEIRNLKSAPSETEADAEPDVSEVHEASDDEMSAAVPATVPASAQAWEDELDDSEPEEAATAPKKKLKQPKAKRPKPSLPKISLPRLSLPSGGVIPMVLSGVALAVAIGALVVGLQAGKSASASVASKDKSVSESVAGLETLITNQNERLGRIEDALEGNRVGKAPAHSDGHEAPAPAPSKPQATGHGEGHGEAKPADTHGAGHGEQGHGSKSASKPDDHGAASHIATSAKKADGHSAKDAHADSKSHGAPKAARKETPGAEGFHFNSKSLKVAADGHKTVKVGGKKLLLSTRAPHGKASSSHRAPKSKSANRPATHRSTHGSAKRATKPNARPAAPAAKPRVKAYLDGVPVN